MWLNEDAPIHKQDLTLEKPYVNASGMLGFAPDARTMPFLGQLGAFITNRSAAARANPPEPLLPALSGDSCCILGCPTPESAQLSANTAADGLQPPCQSSCTCWPKIPAHWRKWFVSWKGWRTCWQWNSDCRRTARLNSWRITWLRPRENCLLWSA